MFKIVFLEISFNSQTDLPRNLANRQNVFKLLGNHTESVTILHTRVFFKHTQYSVAKIARRENSLGNILPAFLKVCAILPRNRAAP
jgi:hypothetical protein